MKKLLIAFGIFAIATGANAQEATTTTKTTTTVGGTTFSVAGNIGTGTKKGYTTTYGGDLQAEFSLGGMVRATASAGYQDFHTPDYRVAGYTQVYDDISYVPVLAGTKISLGKGLYVHPQLGYSFLTRKVKGSNENNGEFTYAASLGHGFGKNFDVAVKYLSIDVVNAVLLRLAYNF